MGENSSVQLLITVQFLYNLRIIITQTSATCWSYEIFVPRPKKLFYDIM